jgi:hypothetical protein
MLVQQSYFLESRDSEVGIVTGLDDSEVEVRVPAG